MKTDELPLNLSLSTAMYAGIKVSKPMKNQMIGYTHDGYLCACPLGAALLGIGWTAMQLQAVIRGNKERALLSASFPVLDDAHQGSFIAQLKGDRHFGPMPLRYLISMANSKWPGVTREAIANALQKCGV